MKVLLLGSGGREHALAWKLSQSFVTEKIYVLPGNAGTADCGPKVCNVGSSQQLTFDDILQYVCNLKVDFVLPSQESHFESGIWDYFTLNGIACFGPSKAAAQLETSKQFAKHFMLRHKIPTPRSWMCEDLASVKQILSNNQDWPIVVKASGLTAGKGVDIAMTEVEALQSTTKLFSIYKSESKEECRPCLLLEEYYDGPEFSVIALTDGMDMLMFPPIKDYKRRDNDDKGRNTGGMGCVAPTALCSEYMLEFVKHNVLLKIIQGMHAEGRPFVGVLCVDVILGRSGPVVLDIDVRFGDAETQTLLPLLDDTTDMIAALLACHNGNIGTVDWRMKKDHCVSVVAVTDEYPERRSQQIKIPHVPCLKTLLFLGASKEQSDHVIAFGGRVLTISAVSSSPKDAANRIRQRLERVKFPGMHFRTDIGS